MKIKKVDKKQQQQQNNNNAGPGTVRLCLSSFFLIGGQGTKRCNSTSQEVKKDLFTQKQDLQTLQGWGDAAGNLLNIKQGFSTLQLFSSSDATPVDLISIVCCCFWPNFKRFLLFNVHSQ